VLPPFWRTSPIWPSDGLAEEDWHQGSPYDVSFIGGWVSTIRQSLVAHLNHDGGRLVAIIDHGQAMSAHLFTKNGPTLAGRRIAGGQPLRGVSRPDVFVS
jgi:protein-L-isoaspartate O-methyltransferase